MKEIPYESGSYYIFDRAYNNFKMLYKVHQIEAFFVVRAKKNLQYKSIKWKRRLPKNVLSDVTIELIGFYPKQYYPEQFRFVRYWDEEQKREFVFLTNAMHISALQVAELYKNRWQVELVLQMAEAAPQNQEVLGYYRKCCSGSNLFSHMYLLPGGNRSTRYATG
jgi:hypothetical protein